MNKKKKQAWHDSLDLFFISCGVFALWFVDDIRIKLIGLWMMVIHFLNNGK